MIDVTINQTYLNYLTIAASYDRDNIELVDDYSIHINTDRGVLLFNVSQLTFNGQSFTNSIEAISFIQTL